VTFVFQFSESGLALIGKRSSHRSIIINRTGEAHVVAVGSHKKNAVTVIHGCKLAMQASGPPIQILPHAPMGAFSINHD